MQISLGFYVFLLSALYASLVGMEPADLANDREAIPLLEQVQEAQDLRLQMDMEEDGETNLDEQNPVLFDGSRRFYDDETRTRVKKKAIKQCLKLTAVETITGTSFAMLIFYFFIYYFLSKHYGINPHALALYASCSASIFVLSSLLFSFESYLGIIRPAIAEQNPFNSHYNYLCWREEKRITIPQSMIDAAHTSFNIPNTHRSAESLYNSCSNNLFKKLHFDILRRIFFSKINYEFHTIMLQRLENPKLSLREEYRNLAYQIKKLLVLKLPREIVCRIFNEFPNKNILEHMIAHYPQDWINEKLIFLNEKELFLRIKKSNLSTWDQYNKSGLSPLIAASILEEHGWIAFSKNKKYPIECHMRFFDKERMLSNPMKHYFAKYINPTIYLPYSAQLAHYYKFEDDPAYTLEHIAPANRKIARLLQLRQEIIGRNPALLQPIQNNNNN